jgi:hypothetical protein
MIVRSHLPWPLRWAALAVMFGFSAALALWAFEFGKEIAGLDRGAKEELAQQVRQLETDKQALQADLGFFQRLLPSGTEGLQLRGLHAEAVSPGQIRYQMVVVNNGKAQADFKGRFELLLAGQLDGKPWSQPLPQGPQALQLRQVTRVEGLIEHPPEAVIKTVQVRVMDTQGVTKATQTVRL